MRHFALVALVTLAALPALADVNALPFGCRCGDRPGPPPRPVPVDAGTAEEPHPPVGSLTPRGVPASLAAVGVVGVLALRRRRVGVAGGGVGR